ncbi:MAG: phosphonate metabolism protein/1,5-bisphosphokinase (PRPP-forming) PhnN [Pseudotabrizicola sp.]|uniref:phosphonate metabolism protein/1,5-bisphosphokinase (PRPP-forming) PhnN n=1 Tax=Pseudotabrizicola sp. TaxID=2939647 RepID=UPI002716C9D2|nr:phosphonate metabolism protein/1,5-bisphosphokinase (PRPP-forming) PhnN [Pseudotabrizicola sp.]MDO8884063.1 phosphonate metabolism protein/1,5-bisphosphokinase (PRPP-forming) PhnN [Pseudotabrizicola sp.]MDP2083392.1 phosphonate metabolism protein/1,5-bisphosphokinase (PRPP-forming) PhnN [Pseudotabrizicola sp.]MDZ7574930.1 phosphonate metabolism protein/1,5-bisphosphokinase (PRPP-forming) PhnN [Pseudotabrizicola sp.]
MIFAVVGPSGAGKDTLIAGACALYPELQLVRRVITRPADAGGEDFEGVTEAQFLRRRAMGEFALDWQAHGLWYGIPKQHLTANGPILFNGSRAALMAAMALMPDLVVILVTAPAEVLAMRLAARGRECVEDVRARLERAGFALPDGIVPRIVVNDSSPDIGVARFLAALYPPNGKR